MPASHLDGVCSGRGSGNMLRALREQGDVLRLRGLIPVDVFESEVARMKLQNPPK